MDNHFGSSLRALRKKKKLTLEDLGEILKISKSSLSDYENEKSYPPLDACALMSKFFGISIDQLFYTNFDKLLRDSSLESFIEQNNIVISEEFNTKQKQLAFENTLLIQQSEGLNVQLKLVKQLVMSKDSEIKSLLIQVRLLDEKLKGTI